MTLDLRTASLNLILMLVGIVLITAAIYDFFYHYGGLSMWIALIGGVVITTVGGYNLSGRGKK